MSAAPLQPGPWSEHRATATVLTDAIAAAMAAAVGTPVGLGKPVSCEPEAMLSRRHFPVRAIVVNFGRPLRDVMVFISSLPDDVVRPLAQIAASSVVAALGITPDSDDHGATGGFVIEDGIEYESMEIAAEQCDAMFLEAMYTMDLPTGDVCMILGTGLLESAACFELGESDPHAREAVRIAVNAFEPTPVPTARPVVVDQLADDAPPVPIAVRPIEMVDEVDERPASDSTTSPDEDAIAAYEARLAAQERADQEAAHADRVARAAAEAAALNAGTSPAPAASVDPTHWAELLSGVEVEVSAELGRTDLALGDITALDSESVLTLDQMVKDPVTVFVNGTPYALARLVVVDGEYGIEILEVLEQSVPLLSRLAA